MKHERRKDKSRVVGARYEGSFNESAMEKLLLKAQRAGTITEFDTGRGSVVWFNGRPGSDFRELRREVAALVSPVA